MIEYLPLRLPPHAEELPDDTPLTVVTAASCAWVLHLRMRDLRRMLKRDEEGGG